MADTKGDKAVGTVVGRSVRIERLIRAPPARVWAAWATRETLEQWFWPSGQGKVREFDFRPGGRLVMAHTDQPWVATWRFKEIVPERRIVLEDLWDDGSGHVATGSVEFLAVPEGTRLVVNHGPFPEKGPYRLEDAVGGFSVVMDRLAALVEAPRGAAAAAMSPRKLVLTREFDAPVERVWAAWTDPQIYAKWLNPAPHDLVIHEFDVRPGGKVRFDMPQPDGNPNSQQGVFHVVERNRRLVSGEPDKSFLVDATFEPLGKKTRLVIEVTGVPPEFHEAATKGWGTCLDKLAGVLADREGVADREIVLSRLLGARRERVWAAWTDPKQVAQWWGPTGFTTTVAEMSVRPGGLWVFTMHGPDGTDYPNWIRYEEVVRPERLAYAHGGGKPGDRADFHGVVTFEDEGGKTRVTLRPTFPTAKDRDRVVRDYDAIEGGKQTLARLADHLARAGGRMESVVLPSDREVLVTRVFEAPRERVWRAFADPQLVARWWGRGNKLVVERLEVERGGHWRFVEHGPDGVHGFEGRFREIAPPERLVYTFEWDGMPGHVVVETTTFEDLGGGRTRVVNRSLFHTSEERDGMLEAGMEEGLSESYAALDRVLATMR